MKCPNCNGTLYYNIKNRNLKCVNCDSTFDVNEYDKNNIASEYEAEDGKLYTCKNCGAELISCNDEAVSYCQYCGSEQILESELAGIRKPKYIVPFKITKSECKKIYEDRLKGNHFVPKDFKDPDFIDKFRPFYIPYWMYTIKFRDDDFELEAFKNYTIGNYDYYDEYLLKTKLDDKGVYGIPYDASRNFDDTIAENIAPFKKKDIVEYKQGYLAGMYADAPNVDAEVYEEEVVKKATDKAMEDLSVKAGGANIKLPKRKTAIEFLDAHYEGAETIYLPVWFLTWKNNDRVAYAIVNGQTGKIHIDLPVDTKTFFRNTVLLGAILFVLLTLFISVTSRFIIWFSALMVYVVSRVYYNELKSIRDRENHVFDKGYLLEEGEKLAMSERKRKRLGRKIRRSYEDKSLSIITINLILIIVIFASFSFMYSLYVSQEGAKGLTALIFILQVFPFVKTVNISRFLKNKRSLLTAFFSMGAILYSLSVALSEPVQDWIYYAGGLLNLAAASAMALDLIIRYNEVSTRPLPSFFSRKGGNDNAKEN